MSGEGSGTEDTGERIIYICPSCKKLGAVKVEIVICPHCGLKEIK